MKPGQRLWTRDELILAINLYCKIPFGQMHASNAHVKQLAALIDRSPGAIARKLGNFASFDPKLKERGVGGLPNASKLDAEVWNDYMQEWDEQFFESEKLLAQKQHTTIEKVYAADLENLPAVQGKEKERLVMVRVNQSQFRRIVLSNFNNQCCITGIGITELLVASHIVPWSQNEGNRLSPQNGLSLNALHDKAFDRHLITITEDLTIKISGKFYKHKDVPAIQQNFIDFDGKPLLPPKKFYPEAAFIKIHNEQFAG